MKRKAVIITGALGGIGTEMCSVFDEAGYLVVAVDRRDGNPQAGEFLQFDIRSCGATAEGIKSLGDQARKIISDADAELHGLINNAAIQILGACEELTHDNWQETLQVNLLAPFFLAKEFLAELDAVHGAVVNISSIHERLTKPRFNAS